MTSVSPTIPVAPAPLGPSRRRRMIRVFAWLAFAAAMIGVLELLGVDVSGWFSDLWDTLTEIGFGYLVAGLALQTVQTTLTALAGTPSCAPRIPTRRVPYRQILAAYAAGVALNGFLPANIGTFVMLLMYVAIIPSANFAGRARRHGRAEDLLHASPARSSTSTCSCRCRARSTSSCRRSTTTPC